MILHIGLDSMPSPPSSAAAPATGFCYSEPATLRRLDHAIDQGVGITHEWNGLHVDGPYLHSSYQLVEHLLKALIRRARVWADSDSP